MSKQVDPELLQLRQEMGAKEYERVYHKLYNKVRYSNQRASGEHYENSKERIQAIKEKYKNGVTREILDEFIKSL